MTIGTPFTLVYHGFTVKYKGEKLEGSISDSSDEELSEDSFIEFDGENEFYDPSDDFPQPPEFEVWEADQENDGYFRQWLKLQIIAEIKEETAKEKNFGLNKANEDIHNL